MRQADHSYWFCVCGVCVWCVCGVCVCGVCVGCVCGGCVCVVCVCVWCVCGVCVCVCVCVCGVCVCGVCGGTDRINLSQKRETLSSGKPSRCVWYCNSLTQRKLYIFSSNVLQIHYMLRSDQDYHQVYHNIKILTLERYLPNKYQEKGPIFSNVEVHKIPIL